MQRPASLDDFKYTDDQIQIIHEANDIERMMQTPGWKRIDALMKELVEVAQHAAASADTSNVPAAIDALREWQNKKDFYEQIHQHAKSLLDVRDQFAPRNNIEVLLLKEQLHGRHSDGSDTSYSV